MSRARTTRQELVRKVDEAMAALDLCFQGSERITLLPEIPGRSAFDKPRSLLAFMPAGPGAVRGPGVPDAASSAWLRRCASMGIPGWNICFTDRGRRRASEGKPASRVLTARPAGSGSPR